MEKVINAIKSTISFILFVAYFIFALIMTVLLLNYNTYGVTQFGDKSFVLVSSKISNDQFKKGDLVITEHTKITDYAVGEYVFTYRIGADRVPTIQLGKIGNVYPEEDALSFENGETYSSEYVAGKPIKQYEKVGGYLSIIQSKWGFLFIVLIPVFLIFIFEVYSLIIEIKYGTEED